MVYDQPELSPFYCSLKINSMMYQHLLKTALQVYLDREKITPKNIKAFLEISSLSTKNVSNYFDIMSELY